MSRRVIDALREYHADLGPWSYHRPSNSWLGDGVVARWAAHACGDEYSHSTLYLYFDDPDRMTVPAKLAQPLGLAL